MKLETKYGTLEGTVEEFRELLEGEKDLSFFSGRAEGKWRKEDKSEYYVVNTDRYKMPTKGTVLKHKSLDIYVDTVGNEYILHKYDLDDYNKSWVDGGFKAFKKDDKLLVAKY